MLIILPRWQALWGFSRAILCFSMDTSLFPFSFLYLLLILGVEAEGRARLQQGRVQLHLLGGGFEDQPPSF